MDSVRIACVRYLNTAPLIEGLEKVEGLTLIPTVPSRIADLVAGGEADIGLVSVVDAAASTVPLALVPCGMIGCDGPTLTVRLFSADPPPAITRLHVDSDSHTSLLLARVLLARVYESRPEVVVFDARERVERGVPAVETSPLEESWPRSVVLIGDKVITDPPPADRYPHQLDLGEAWKTLTGLPFVYAMWACRSADRASPKIKAAAMLLDRQLRHNYTRLEWIVAQRAPEARWPMDVARRYLGELLRYRVGSRERQATERFLTLAAEQGLIDSRKVEWAWQP